MEEKINEQYLKGFNNAYFLAKHKPSVLNSLLATNNKSQYVLGMIDGKKTYEQERQISRMNEIQRLHSREDREYPDLSASY